MKLDTLQLLSAWTWNDDFDLLEQFRELKEELEDFGFSGVGEDTDLILRCAAAILMGNPTADTLLELNGLQVRSEFPRVRNGIFGAIDFMKKQLKIASLKNLPYSALIIPLSSFFAEPDGKDVNYDSVVYNRLKKWFWRSCFTKRYSSQIKRTATNDIKEMLKLKNGEQSVLGDINCDISEEFFIKNQFRLGNAPTKTFILMLANQDPKSFLSGSLVDLDRVLQNYNRSEFHHVYPKAYLKDLGFNELDINCLANFCFLSGSENRKISRKKPSEYIKMMPIEENLDDILQRSFCPKNTFDDDFDAFRSQRADLLSSSARSLLQI